MARIFALATVLFVGEAQAQEPIVLEEIGAVHMALPDELRSHDDRADISARPEDPAFNSAPEHLSRSKASLGAGAARPSKPPR